MSPSSDTHAHRDEAPDVAGSEPVAEIKPARRRRAAVSKPAAGEAAAISDEGLAAAAD